MRVPRGFAALPVLGGALLLMLFPVGCSDDESPTGTGGNGGTGGTGTIPASWGGTWQITSTPGPGPARGSTEIGVVQLCAGTSVQDLLGTPEGVPDFAEVTCTGSWGDVEVDITCSGSASFEGCTITFSSSLRLTRTGESFSGTQSNTITYSGTCGSSEETISEDIDGVRLSSSQFACDSNLDRELPASWGGTWNIVESMGGGRGAELLCPGTDIMYIFDAGNDPEQIGGFTETTAEVLSSWTTPAGNCLEIHTEQYDLVRSGDTFTGTRTSSYYTVNDPSGGGGDCTDQQTTVYDITGTRLSTDISGCGRSTYVPDQDRWTFLGH